MNLYLKPPVKTPAYYFELAEGAAEAHRYSSAAQYAAKGLALFPRTGMKAPQMRLAAEYRQKRAEWMQDAAKEADKALCLELAGSASSDASIELAFPEEFKIWRASSEAARQDILARSPTPAGHYKRLAVCMATIRDDLKKAAERARLIESGGNTKRNLSGKGPRVPSEKEVFAALDKRKAATKRRMGLV